MPGEQHFDPKHLQDVVLAQSEQIQVPRRFSDPVKIKRPVLALTIVVTMIAIGLGIRDYVEEQKARPLASISGHLAANAQSVNRAKKVPSGRRRGKRVPTIESTARAISHTAANDLQEQLVSEDVAHAGNKVIAVMGDGANPPDQAEASRGDNMGHGEVDTIAEQRFSTCLPLPNGTRPGDVDARYYFGWAGEYCGRDLASDAAVAESGQSKE